MSTAEKIRIARETQNLSIEQAAAKVRRVTAPDFVRAVTTGQPLSDWWHAVERGWIMPSPRGMALIADALGYKPSDLEGD